MKQFRFLPCLAATALAVSTVLAASAHAKEYPVKPVKIVVPFAAGGGADQLARMIALHWQTALGTPVIVDNKTGGNTVIAAEYVARAEPDGYTLLLTTGSTMAVTPNLYARLPYDAQKSFTPVGQVSQVPFFLTVPASGGITSVADLIAKAKAKPGAISYASAGSGTTGHLAFELLGRTAGFEAIHVPYKSYAAAIPDLVTARVSALIADIPVIGSQLKSGQLRALATTGKNRSPFLPQIPTLVESGIAGFDMSVWFGVFAPMGTPPQVIAQLNTELQNFLLSSTGKEKFNAIGHNPAPSTPEALSTLVRTETEKWGKVIRDAGIKPD